MAPCLSLSLGQCPASSTPAPTSKPRDPISSHARFSLCRNLPKAQGPAPGHQPPQERVELVAKSKDEAGDPAVTQTLGPLPAASCCPSSPQPPRALAPHACQAWCQRYFPNGSSACFACRSPRLPAGWRGPAPLQAAGEGFHGYAGLGSPAYRWQSILAPTARSLGSLLLPSRTQSTFWVPTQGKGMWEAVTGEFLVPRACTAVRDASRKRPMETLQRGVSRAVDKSGFLLQLGALFELFWRVGSR